MPSSQTFCRSALHELKSRNHDLCPVCTASSADQSVDSPPVIVELAESFDEMKPMYKIHSAQDQNICVHDAVSVAWCEDCKLSSCIKCLKANHRSCNWASVEEKTSELLSILQETVASKRATLHEKFMQLTTEGNSLLTDIKANIKQMKNYEEIVESFLEKLSIKKRKMHDKLYMFEHVSSNCSVMELRDAISTTLSLENPMKLPIIPKIVLPDYEESTEDTDSDEDMDSSIYSNTTVRPKTRDIGTLELRTDIYIQILRDCILAYNRHFHSQSSAKIVTQLSNIPFVISCLSFILFTCFCHSSIFESILYEN